MKQSLLSIVQEILSDMNSDPVNSISDTTEAQQVAMIVKRTFVNMANERVWPANNRLFKLTPSGDSTRPTHMRIEEDVIEVNWVKYNVERTPLLTPSYSTINFVSPHEFVVNVLSRDALRSNVQTVTDYNGNPLFIHNDASPTYYTSFDDTHLVFDSFDSTVDGTLQASKTQVFGQVEPEFLLEDGFVADIPAKYFPYLVNESKSTCFIKIKEVFSQKDEQNSGRQKAWLSRNKHRNGGETKYPDYGRNGSGGGRYRAGYRNNHFTG